MYIININFYFNIYIKKFLNFLRKNGYECKNKEAEFFYKRFDYDGKLKIEYERVNKLRNKI